MKNPGCFINYEILCESTFFPIKRQSSMEIRQILCDEFQIISLKTFPVEVDLFSQLNPCLVKIASIGWFSHHAVPPLNIFAIQMDVFFRCINVRSSRKNHLINVSVWLININFSHLWRLSFSVVVFALLSRCLYGYLVTFSSCVFNNHRWQIFFGKVVAYEKSWSLNAPYTELKPVVIALI